jgi:hypothetical protein
LDTGYYPSHIFARAQDVAAKLGVPHVRIGILDKYMNQACETCFEETMALYDQPETDELSRRFLDLYKVL